MPVIVLALIAVLAAPVTFERTAPEDLSQATPSRAAILAAARVVVDRARYATFGTLDERGAPQARIVDPFSPEDEFTIWVATNSRSRKVEQIARDPRVVLTYLDRVAQHYVTIVGTAVVVRDLAARAARWKEEWAPFYADGYRGDDYVLLRVIPVRLEIVAPELGMINDPTTWRPVVLELRSPAALH
jgi:general stress protein 26